MPLMRETPTLIDAGHAHTVYGLGNLASGTAVAGTMLAQNYTNQAQSTLDGWAQAARAVPEADYRPKKEKPMSARRLVQVFIVDPDDNVPLNDSLIHRGEQKLTDLTDQELFFEIDIKTLLSAHNEVRVKLVNKKVKERTEYLEPARIRDLKMVVVNVASF